ncbi:hypothetical protein [Rhizobium sp. G21]|uniref:hypothetical protein n=1 Tax=Rhizobium sp. G21 TaxID=2758439 RepID=UPI0015FF7ACD|nr:hypothetical protein [Rhizobium sp. G21]MBB1248271.1 hypothetical protein [Rhizobium sp. G21]
MDDTKAWHQSKTVWGALVAILASVLQAAGSPLAPGMEHDLVEALTTLAGAAGGLLAIYGRLSADRRVS